MPTVAAAGAAPTVSSMPSVSTMQNSTPTFSTGLKLGLGLGIPGVFITIVGIIFWAFKKGRDQGHAAALVKTAESGNLYRTGSHGKPLPNQTQPKLSELSGTRDIAELNGDPARGRIYSTNAMRLMRKIDSGLGSVEAQARIFKVSDVSTQARVKSSNIGNQLLEIAKGGPVVMAAQVTSLQPIKQAPGPSPLTPEQTYWRTFKSQQLVPSPSNNPITHISFASTTPNAATQPPDYFAVTTGPRVQIFSIKYRKLIKTISRFDDIAHGAEIRRDGRVMAAGDDTGAIQVFDINSRAILKTWKEHKQPVWTAKFSPFELTTLMSASDDRTVRLWDLPAGGSVTTFVGHQDYVRSGAFMPGQASGLVVSGSYDQTVRIWDPRTPTRAVMTFKHTAPVEAVLTMPSGTTILAAADNQVSILDIIAARPLQMLQNHQKTVTSLCLASHAKRLVTGGLDGHVKIFETTGWNIVAGSKYSSPVLSMNVVSSGSEQDDRHLVVGMQSGVLSIKTRLTGQQKVKEREREKEMQALLSGSTEAMDKKSAKKIPKGVQRGLRGRDFTGEGADIVIDGNKRELVKKPKPWEKALRTGKYFEALDKVLEAKDLGQILTLLTALRHQSAMRAALSGRDEETIRPVFIWVCKYITDPRHVAMCVDVSIHILDMYATQMGQSKDFDDLMRRLHEQVRREADRAQQAWQTQGMLGMLIDA
ncbi:MAG: hypothetical protein MMC33_007288 [Icmadophila ericetorum]|nr:hypothetical protein [Icmadophila ericetorum]